MKIDNVLFNIGEIILILISMVFIYRIFLRSKRRIKMAYLCQFLALVILVLNLILIIFKEKGFAILDIAIKLVNLLFLAVLTFSYSYMQKSFTLAEQELNDKGSFELQFKRKK